MSIPNATCVAALAVTAALAFSQAPQQPTAPAAADQAVINDFNQRVQQYLATRKKASSGGPPQTSDAAKLNQYRRKLHDAIASVRDGAKQGDIFTPEIAAFFKKQIANTLTGPQGTRIRASLRRAEPVHGVPLRINGAYPAGIPLQSTPASLLLNLPQLPRELEYRIANRALVLRDKDANLIVDYIPDVIAAAAPSHPAHDSQPSHEERP